MNPGKNKPSTARHRVEMALWCLGVVCVGAWGLARAYTAHAQSVAMAVVGTEWRTTATAGPDTELWSAQRLASYEDARRNAKTPAPIAVLDIPAVGIRVAVADGTASRTLDVAVGRVPGTAVPGTAGNLALAGHRDGFFRGLKDIAIGDEMLLQYDGGLDHYVVTGFFVTNPDDVSVLEPTPQDTLTLITCYPFYFVGSAPQRFIVTAEKLSRSRS